MRPLTAPQIVIGPLGYPLTLENLPPAGTTRWTAFRKAEVVAALDGGLLEFEQACDRYELTIEELAGWQRGIRRFGLHALRATKATEFRT